MGLMQIGAWALMIGQRSEKQELATVVRVAFLGTSPCQRCLVVAEGTGKSQGEDKNVWELNATRLIQVRREGGRFPERFVARPILVFSIDVLFLASRSEKPPTPPPRQLVVS